VSLTFALPDYNYYLLLAIYSLMAKFDLSKTQEVGDLLTVERAQRDKAWRTRFYDAIVDASMATIPKQAVQGPDGFPYFVLKMPPAEEAFEPFCISHILDVCLENGLGVVFNPESNPPDWVFPYGQLWALKEFGKLDMEPPAHHEGETAEEASHAALRQRTLEGNSVLVGQPSEAFFPSYARKAVKKFLTERTGQADPGVLLMSDPRSPSPQSLVFSIFAEDFKTEKEFGTLMYLLEWFFPLNYGFAAISKDSELAKGFQAL